MSHQWQGANISPARQRRRASAQGGRGFTQEQETVESALNRLSKAYATTMECVGAWQRAARTTASTNDNNPNDDTTIVVETLTKIGRTARRTFERAILLDPLVVVYAPALEELHGKASSTSLTTHTATLTSGSHIDTVRQLAYLSLVNYSDLLLTGCPPTKKKRRSDSEEATAEEGSTTAVVSLLDRGIVQPLGPFSNTSCWGNNNDDTTITTTSEEQVVVESELETVRRALVALLDATALDARDATVWLKLACVARRLGRLLSDHNNSTSNTATTTTPAVLLVHRRLEKHALERGLVALPDNVPPFPLLVRAHQEWCQEEAQLEQQTFQYSSPSTLFPNDDDDDETCLEPKIELKIELSRYSWSALVRILLRVCREGSLYSPDHQHHLNHRHTALHSTTAAATATSSSTTATTTTTASPSLSIRLSPMLALPSAVLARTCQYLEPADICRFEATCRALSYSILSAQTIVSTMNNKDTISTNSEGNKNKEPPSQQQAAAVPPLEASAKINEDGVNNNDSNTENEGGADSERSSTQQQQQQQQQRNRASSRLRSQQITTEKRSERSQRRSSTEFCLVAATLGCTPADPLYQELVACGAAGMDSLWNNNNNINDPLQLTPDESYRSTGVEGGGGAAAARRGSSSTTLDKFRRQREEARERLSDSSLLAFLYQCQSPFANNMTTSTCLPISVLFAFVAHVSIHIADVFSSDPGGSMVLSSSLLECIELMLRRCHHKNSLIPSWSSGALACPRGSNLSRMNLFAIDLIHAELRLKRCDHDEHVDTGFDSDGNVVTTLIPTLLESLAELDEEMALLGKSSAEWIRLKARCYWLTTNFYFWRGRISHMVSESREAEREGLDYTEKTLSCLTLPVEQPVGEVVLPHLDSPSRSGHHWKLLSFQTLVAFRNEIQASSIVLAAQEQFLEATSKIKANDGDELSEQDSEALFAIGDALLKRYDTPIDSSQSKHVELIDDFLTVHGESMLAKAAAPKEELAESDYLLRWFDSVVPSREVGPDFILSLSNSPCILSILLTCLHTKADNRLHVAQLNSRLVVTIANRCRNTLKSSESKNGVAGDISDDDSFASSEDEMDSGSGLSDKNLRIKLRQYGLLLRLAIQKTSENLQGLNHEDLLSFSGSDNCLRMVHDSLAFCAERFTAGNACRSEESDVTDDLAVFQSFRGFFRVIQQVRSPEASLSGIDRPYVAGLIRIITQQRQALACVLKSAAGRQGRTMRQKLIWRRTQLLAESCCEVGLILSTHRVQVVAGVMTSSDVFNDSICDNTDLALAPLLPVFCESLVWLWKVALNNESSTKDRLLVPVATAVIGLCGSASCTNRRFHGRKERSELSLFDSDASSADWLSDDETDDPSSVNATREDLLRVISQAVHCVDNVIGLVDEHDATSFSYCEWYVSAHGPLLPLVASRVLNLFADRLLLDFVPKDASSEDKSKAVWLKYPYGTRTTGLLLDSLLYKAYKCLHGFTLVNACDAKDTPSSATTRSALKRFPAEDVKAAAMLYRCIMRAYSEGRKSPPKAALDTVLDALPPMEESPKSRLIRDYLFSTKRDYFELKDLLGLVSKSSNWDSVFSEAGCLGWESLQSRGGEDDEAPEDEIMIVRKGISNLLAQGVIPTYQESDGDERTNSSQTEEELGRKFLAIIDDLSLGSSTNCEAWFKAAQCLISKADLIADRLGLSTGFSRNHNFHVPDRVLPSGMERSLDLPDMIAEQEREEKLKAEGWLCSLGEDLSIYSNYNWCSFASLQSAAVAIGSTYRRRNSIDAVQDPHKQFCGRVYYEISALLTKNDFAGWQQAWGGLFVSSLRKIAIRCLCVALYIAYKTETVTQSDRVLVSEISESIGVILYSELSGSQVYGYPMQSMTRMRKRLIAEAALVCFERAIDVLESSGDTKDRSTWDLLFMVGKCNEKIANTYEREAFKPLLTQTEGDRFVRRYEYHVGNALQAYAASLDEAREEEKEGLVEEQSGGSNHGAAEVFYRLHASRLKCLIAAVDRKEDEREAAELEGLRLTEQHWRSKPDEAEAVTELRDRVWAVLSDIVVALVQCRIDFAFFHRSVYRHAQALMWAPVLCDPIGERPNGSLGTVPATRACKLRGLNFSTNAAESAVSVIGGLFEKKRTQLCAVWVTNSTSASPFQTINSTTRKYDALRGKYISAYIDSLRLCKKKKEIETFLRWALSCQRDLPSYFTASAMAQGGPPKTSHVVDGLLVKSRSISSFHFLTTVKRQANSALAAVISHEISNCDTSTEDENPLKAAYACFLRLNCDPEVLVKSRSWRYPRNSIKSAIGGTKDIVDALTAAYLEVRKDAPSLSGPRSDWSGDSQIAGLLQAALKECKALFPNLSGTFYTATKRKSPAGKKKRKQPQNQDGEMIKKSFDVTVPDGLSAGDSFLVSIPIQGQHKKVRLTVPNQPTRSMRFSLEVPADDGNAATNEDDPPSKKARKTDDGED